MLDQQVTTCPVVIPFLDNRYKASPQELRAEYRHYDSARSEALVCKLLSFLQEAQPKECNRLCAWATHHAVQRGEEPKTLVFAALCKAARESRKSPDDVVNAVIHSKSARDVLLERTVTC